MIPERSSAAARDAIKNRAVGRNERMYRTAKITVRFSAIANNPEVQHIAPRALTKVSDRSSQAIA